MILAIASGKGGTGKTLVATNLAAALGAAYVDCDVEGANGHLFLKPEIADQQPAVSDVPKATDACTGCGACAKVCAFSALAALKSGVLVFNELCHSCGACLEACPSQALRWTTHVLGHVRVGRYRVARGQWLPFADGELAVGQVRASAVIAQVKEAAPAAAHTILDCPPGCSCAVTEALRGTDLCLLVTEPTPFGLSDLEKAIGLVEHLAIPHAVILNRCDIGGADVRGFCNLCGIPIVLEVPHDMAIAGAYAEGHLLYAANPRYAEMFDTLAEAVRTGSLPCRRPAARPLSEAQDLLEEQPPARRPADPAAKPLTRVAVVSGKGGTGKTSLAASLAVLGQGLAVADGDVDAANLHLVLFPRDEEGHVFSGSWLAVVDPQMCRGCGVCANECRFDAITLTPRATVDPLRCEGCGLCALVCPLAGTDEMPVRIHPRLSGHAHVGTTDWGPMARGSLLAGGEASGKLVTLVRTLADEAAAREDAKHLLIDASPGTGCPVNASLTGCDLAVVVTEPTLSGLHDMERVLDLAAWFRIPAMAVINKADLCARVAEEIRCLCRRRDIEVVGEVPFDRNVPENLSRSVVPALGDGPGAEALRNVCGTILARLEAARTTANQASAVRP
ncbi:MAG TPA: 4Fe-4S binding protein [Phycisphaerae bacterium]|nr:4Fe-4S binding protein [Phycisphaerae bacterium]